MRASNRFTGTLPTGQFLAPPGTAAAPGYAFTGFIQTGWFVTAGNLEGSVGGTRFVSYTSNQWLTNGVGAADLGGASNSFKRLYMDYTNTGTVGNVTINKAAGRVNLGAGGSTLTLTNSFITAASHVLLQESSAPGNAVAVSYSIVPAAGSAVITATPVVTNQTSIDFFVVNAD